MAEKDPGKVEGKPEGIQDVLKDGSIGSVDFRVRDMDSDSPHGMGSAEF